MQTEIGGHGHLCPRTTVSALVRGHGRGHGHLKNQDRGHGRGHGHRNNCFQQLNHLVKGRTTIVEYRCRPSTLNTVHNHPD